MQFFILWAQLAKIRLTLLVVFSSVVSYFTIYRNPDFRMVMLLALGGLFITAASNTLNQWMEYREDGLMERTSQRPIPSGKISRRLALGIGCMNAVLGSVILFQMGWLPLLLGLLSLFLYVFAYTPLKKKTPWAVLVGAFPGSLPVLIGSLAQGYSGVRQLIFAFVLFLIQFVWQFPHFWSLAWFNFNDYARASFFLLPTGKEKNERAAFYVFVYCIFLTVFSLLPFFMKFTGWLSGLCILVCSIGLVWQAFLFYRIPRNDMARRVFLISLVYLPVVQLSLLTGI